MVFGKHINKKTEVLCEKDSRQENRIFRCRFGNVFCIDRAVATHIVRSGAVQTERGSCYASLYYARKHFGANDRVRRGKLVFDLPSLRRDFRLACDACCGHTDLAHQKRMACGASSRIDERARASAYVVFSGRGLGVLDKPYFHHRVRGGRDIFCGHTSCSSSEKEGAVACHQKDFFGRNPLGQHRRNLGNQLFHSPVSVDFFCHHNIL